MAQASLSRSWHQLSRSLQRSILQWLDLPSVQPIVQSLIRYTAISKRWLVSGAALLVLVLWNWRLVVSLGLGLVVLAIGYLLQQGQGKRLWAAWQQWWQSVDRSLVLTVGSSLFVTGTSYLTLSIWREMGSSWLAIGFLVQGAAVLTVLGLLVWQVWQHRMSRSPENAALKQDWLTDLADADPLKRLLAVRQLTHALTQNHPSLLLTPKELAESFRLTLNRETEPIVCRALLESLQVLDSQVLALQASHQPAVQVAARIMEARTMEPIERDAK